MSERGGGMQLTRCAFIAALFALVGCASRPTIESVLGADGAFSVETLPRTAYFVIPVSLAGNDPVPFLLDTASTTLALYPDAADRVDPPASGAEVLVRGIASVDLRPQTYVAEVAIGPQRYRDVRSVLLRQPRARPEIQGLIGLNMLTDHVVHYDADERVLTFVPGERFRARAFESWDTLPVYRSVPGVEARGLVFISMRVGGRWVPAVIDTGSERSFINWDLARRDPVLGMVRRRLRQQWTIEGAVGEFDPVARARFEKLTIGRQEWRDAEVIITELPAFEAEDGFPTPIVILGADFLADQHFVLDLPGNRLFLRPIREPDFGNDPLILQPG